MGLSALNLATLNARRLRDPSKCTRLLGELSNLRMDFTAVQETHFTCAADCRVLENDYVVLSVYGNRSSVGGLFTNADVYLVLAGDGGLLVAANIAVKSFEFRVVAVYAPNIAAERISFIRRLAPFLDDPKRTVLVGDWNAILDTKIDLVGRRA